MVNHDYVIIVDLTRIILSKERVADRGLGAFNMEELFTYENIQKLNELEIGIYKFVLNNRDKIQYMTIRELAAEVHTSTASIIRFCGKLGCLGYSEFREKLKQYLEQTMIKEPGDDLGDILHYFERANTSAFETELEKAAHMIRKAQKVIFVGIGSSGTLGKYAARYFSNMGKFSLGLEDPYYPVLTDMTDDTIVIALSVSGETKLLIDLLTRFQKHKCKLLSITSDSSSTIAKMSDWNIAYHMSQRVREPFYNVTTQVPVIFIIEALARRL